MLIVTGAAGFIGSAFIWKLNQMGLSDILAVDNLGTGEKWRNLAKLRFSDCITKEEFLGHLQTSRDFFGAKAVIHLGACSATTQKDAGYLLENNYRYSLAVARYCLEANPRLIYASSAATYGDGSLGFDDDPQILENLRPMNAYAYSKQLFDLGAMRAGWLNSMVGLKFFNVYGPNEYHKGEMMSVACQAFAQIKDSGAVRLFKSHRQGCPHGGQARDFIYIKDCVEVLAWLLENPQVNGLFNLGTGKARTFADLAGAVFKALGKEPNIEFIDMPEVIRDTYQYHTEAKMERLRKVGYGREFMSLEEGVGDYVRGYLEIGDHFL